MPCNLRTIQGGQGSLTILLEVKPARGNALNVSQLATGPKSGKKEIPGPYPVCKQVIRSEPVQSQRGWGLPILRWLCWMTEVVQGFWQLPTTRCPISIKEPRVVFEVAGKKTSFLIDTRASYSIPISHSGLLSSKSCTMTDAGGKPRTCFFTGPPTCQFEQCLILHAFLVVPECPTPLVEEAFWAPSEPYYDLEFLSSPFLNSD